MIKTKTYRYLDQNEREALEKMFSGSQRKLARELGISVSYLNMILQGKKPITEKIIGRFESIGIRIL